MVTKIEKYKKEMEKLNKKALKLLDKSLGDFIPEEACELLPLIEVGASWEVCPFVSHIYLPSSSGSPYPDIFF